MNGICKDKRVVLLLYVLAAVYAAIVCLGMDSGSQMIIRILKFTAVAVCFFTSVLTVKYSFCHDDAKLLTAGLFFTLLADTAFLFAQTTALGIVIFYFAHLCYIRRYRRESFKRNLVMASAVLLFCAAGLLSGLKLPYIFILGVFYAVLIFTVTGLAFRSHLPKINKRLAGAGMILFLLCDTNVTLSFLAPQTGMLHDVADALVWVFYIPSQALLSLSAADYGHNAQSSVREQAQPPSGKTGLQGKK